MDPGAVIRVLLADDDALLRAGVAVILGTADGIEVVGEAPDGLRAVELCASLAPDVILMDVRMPGLDGIEATRRIVAAGSAARILVLTTFQHDEYVWGALQAGASGFLLKRASPERLIDAIRTLAAGDALIDPAVTRDLVEVFVRRAPAGPRASADAAAEANTNTHTNVGAQVGANAGAGAAVNASVEAAARNLRRAGLTDRETQVLRLVAQGCSNGEIAGMLFIAESTVKTHVKRILAKVGARDRAQAVVVAYQAGLVVSRGRGSGPPGG